MLPSETSRGKAWLSNFQVHDRPFAQILLDSLRVVAAGEFRAAMKDAITLAALGAPRGQTNILALGAPSPTAPSYRSPSDLVRTGSDHVLAEIVERIAAQTSQQCDLGVKTMLKRKTRRIVIVTDSIGSGDQVVRLVEFLYKNPTIRSWHSGKFISFHVVAYSVSLEAQARLTSHRAITSVQSVEVGRDLHTTGWSDGVQSAVRDLAIRYANKRAEALGWDGTGGLTTFAHSIPNNTPLVIRQTSGPPGSTWNALFVGGRRGGWSAATEREIGDYRPPRIFGTTMSALGRLRLGRLTPRDLGVLRSNGFGESTLDLLQVLAMRSRGFPPIEITQQLGVTTMRINDLLRTAEANGYLDAEGTLTARGRGILNFAARKQRQLRRTPLMSVYYPQSLR
ncbi:hypothetical protein PYV02_15160 [Leifsonia sp. H3M29-4]|uniref:phosphoribosyltransferase-like protein n=1 Tax=Salinibacterium metalliresistens TaxID=3031321 RepID=UPI0023DA738B|nr:hypothetical protein [Salinibacterium metalliresistens]MDF1480419.1 hypothetical protein [Salinibacterium metalliresistens]